MRFSYLGNSRELLNCLKIGIEKSYKGLKCDWLIGAGTMAVRCGLPSIWQYDLALIENSIWHIRRGSNRG